MLSLLLPISEIDYPPNFLTLRVKYCLVIPPNYLKLRNFGCLCYPWLKPYANLKLEPKSQPCIFLGYSLHQNSYKCLDDKTNRLYVSHRVIFNESIFPFASKDTVDKVNDTSFAGWSSHLPIFIAIPSPQNHPNTLL